ncbi:hypothetical protein FOL47_004745, partial [Perkinsus chesapeaki]
EAVDAHYPRWMAACSRVLERAIRARQEYQSLTDPRLSVVGLLEEWATLPSLAGRGGRGRVTSLLEKERKIYSKLNAHPEGTTLSWVTRKACYLAIIKSFPRVKGNGESFMLLFQDIKACQSYECVMDTLSRHAHKAGYKDADELVGTFGEPHPTHERRESRDGEIPRPKFRHRSQFKGSERQEGRARPREPHPARRPRSVERGQKRPVSFFSIDPDKPPKKRSRVTAIDYAKACG